MRSILNAESVPTLFNTLSGITKHLGFDYCAYDMQLPWPITRPQKIMLNNYPANWQQRYTQRGYAKIDSTITHGKRSTFPLIWPHKDFIANISFWEDARARAARWLGTIMLQREGSRRIAQSVALGWQYLNCMKPRGSCPGWLTSPTESMLPVL
ncbi:autoinducer binding domain-containing protein [Collimonas sp. H4R21]|uniref:Autoinducer binding domain-containing protein n=1 Tax=Collimonas rhizosphaerae TaxID=3126357 RepID=A0ABU9PYN6_9BURK